MKKTLLFLLLFFTLKIYSQQYIFCKVVSEENTGLSGVLVLNTRTDEKAFTDTNGNFMISGKKADILRFVKQKFDRITYITTPEDFEKSIKITLIKSAFEIKEVEIKTKLTGYLREDIKRVEPKQKTKLSRQISKYIAQKTDLSILKARAGEFVQPKGEGFSIGKVSNRCDKIDLENDFLDILGEEYFNELGLQKSEISAFINYVMRSMDLSDALKCGYLKSAEILKFQQLAEEKIKDFKKLK